MDFLASGIMVVTSVVSPVLAWWGSSRYFAGRFEEWKKSSEEWRTHVNKRLDTFDVAARATLDENLKLRLVVAEAEIVSLREWKHVKVDPYLGAVDVLKTRIDNVEARVNALRCQ